MLIPDPSLGQTEPSVSLKGFLKGALFPELPANPTINTVCSGQKAPGLAFQNKRFSHPT